MANIEGTDGNDVLTGENAEDILFGYEGDDRLIAGGYLNRLFGGSGNDTLETGDYDEIHLLGEEGDDVYVVNWTSAIAADPRWTELHENENGAPQTGNDRLDLSAVADDFENVTIISSTALEFHIFDDNGDLIGEVELSGMIDGDGAYYGGFETLTLGDGDYTLTEGLSAAELLGQLKYDATTGDDAITLTSAFGEAVSGMAGDDTLTAASGGSTLYGGADMDQLVGGDGGDRLYGGTHADNIDGGAGNDVIYADHGQDTIVGGDGTDVIQYLSSGVGVTVNLATGAGTGGQAQGDVISGIENLRGSRASDNLTGDEGDNRIIAYGGWDTLEGGGGDDRLEGWRGHDLINGGDGNDVILGGAHNDTLTGGAGDDTLSGGAGSDLFIFSAGSATDVITDFDTASDTLDLSAATTDFTDTASVEAAASVVDGGLLIDLGGGDSLFLEGLTLDDIAEIAFTL